MSLKFSGQPDDGLHTGPKHVAVYCISLLIIIIVVFMTVCIYRYIYTTALYYWPNTKGMTHLKIIIIYLTAIGLSPGGSGYFTCIQSMKLVTNKFKSGGLHEKHVVATWNLGNHLSICL